MKKSLAWLTLALILGLGSPARAVNMDVPGAGGGARAFQGFPYFGHVSKNWVDYFAAFSKAGRWGDLNNPRNQLRLGPMVEAFEIPGPLHEAWARRDKGLTDSQLIDLAVLQAVDLVEAKALETMKEAENPAYPTNVEIPIRRMGQFLDLYSDFLTPRTRRQLEQAQKLAQDKYTEFLKTQNAGNISRTEEVLSEGHAKDAAAGSAKEVGPVAGQESRAASDEKIAEARGILGSLHEARAREEYGWNDEDARGNAIFDLHNLFTQNPDDEHLQFVIVNGLVEELGATRNADYGGYLLRTLVGFAEKSKFETVRGVYAIGAVDDVARAGNPKEAQDKLEAIVSVVKKMSPRIKDLVVKEIGLKKMAGPLIEKAISDISASPDAPAVKLPPAPSNSNSIATKESSPEKAAARWLSAIDGLILLFWTAALFMAGMHHVPLSLVMVGAIVVALALLRGSF